jgi:hypothetical protein
LKNQLKRLESPGIGGDLESIGPVHEGTVRYNELRKRVDQLSSELVNSETIREDLKMKCKDQESELLVLQGKVKELNVSFQSI